MCEVIQGKGIMREDLMVFVLSRACMSSNERRVVRREMTFKEDGFCHRVSSLRMLYSVTLI